MKWFIKAFAQGAIGGAIGALLVTLLVSTGHCMAGMKHDNNLGVVQYQTNPFMYEAVNEVLEVNNVNGNLNLRVNPIGTYMLYDENILICGLPVDKFVGIHGPFIMTLERVSHHTIDGVGCHELKQVNGIVPKEVKIEEQH